MITYVLMAGLPGTGKSTLAKALAQELDGVVLSKDDIRATLFSGPLTDYTREQDDLCFHMLLQAANYLATRGRPKFVFLDGRTFSRKQQVEQAIQAAEAVSCPWRILQTICPDALAEARLVKDATHHPAANRSVALYREVKARFEPISHPHLEIDTSRQLDQCVRQGLAYLTDI